MHEPDAGQSSQVRGYEKRSYRHRRLYWFVLLPISVVLVTSYALGYFQEGLMLASLGVLVVMMLMLREIIDVLGYLGYVQRDAADEREAIRQDIDALKARNNRP